MGSFFLSALVVLLCLGLECCGLCMFTGYSAGKNGDSKRKLEQKMQSQIALLSPDGAGESVERAHARNRVELASSSTKARDDMIGNGSRISTCERIYLIYLI